MSNISPVTESNPYILQISYENIKMSIRYVCYDEAMNNMNILWAYGYLHASFVCHLDLVQCPVANLLDYSVNTTLKI